MAAVVAAMAMVGGPDREKEPRAATRSKAE